MYPVPPQAPKTLGVEFSGTIEEVEQGSEGGWQKGDEVLGLAYGGMPQILFLLHESCSFIPHYVRDPITSLSCKHDHIMTSCRKRKQIDTNSCFLK